MMEQLQKQDISIITPCRNNATYLKSSYESVREYIGPEPEYCVAVDYSQDSAESWCEEILKKDKNFKYIVNDGTWFGENKGELDRMGHCRLYDKLILEVSTKPAFLILHADMRVSKDFIENMLKHLDRSIIVSGTRIEPSIHPSDKSKIQEDFGLEIDEFDDVKFDNFVDKLLIDNKDKITNGFFAPWLAYKEDFLSIGGHDQETFGYQSREDSDIANRFVLNGYKLIQARDAFCYHLTMRGSRRNPKLTDVLHDSDEWTKHNLKSTRNFIRKWGHMIRVDENMYPIIPHKYNIVIMSDNATYQFVNAFEPYFDKMYIDDQDIIDKYISNEQKNTIFDLSKRVLNKSEFSKNDNCGINIMVDINKLDNNTVSILTKIPDILTDSGEIGEFEIYPFKFTINSLETFEKDLIKCKK